VIFQKQAKNVKPVLLQLMQPSTVLMKENVGLKVNLLFMTEIKRLRSYNLIVTGFI
jgi:hypothetical protein